MLDEPATEQAWKAVLEFRWARRMQGAIQCTCAIDFKGEPLALSALSGRFPLLLNGPA
jgi:hypothetical protein